MGSFHLIAIRNLGKFALYLGHFGLKLGALWPKIGGTWPKIEGTFGADGAAMALSAAPLYQSLCWVHGLMIKSAMSYLFNSYYTLSLQKLRRMLGIRMLLRDIINYGSRGSVGGITQFWVPGPEASVPRNCSNPPTIGVVSNVLLPKMCINFC